MQNIDIAIVKSAFENLTKLNDKVYFEAQKEGYHQMVTKTSDGVQTSLYIFNELKNRPEIEALINEHEFTTEAKIYFGKVTSIAEYTATEFSKAPTRIKVTVDNGESFSIPQVAKGHLKVTL
jgi:hypothetical protein